MPQPIPITLPDDLRLAVIEIARSEGVDAETVIAEAVRRYVSRPFKIRREYRRFSQEEKAEHARIREQVERELPPGEARPVSDPIVDEIHEIRRKMLEECGGDMDKLWERIKAAEAKHPERLITKEELDRRCGRSVD